MITKQQILAEIERRKRRMGKSYYPARMELLSILGSLPDEPITPCKELAEAAEKYADGPECSWVGTSALEQAFIAGAEWQKRKMMEGAVEGRIEEVSFNNGELHNTIFFSFNEESLHVENRIWFPRCGKEGDKVRIIIVKEDEQ